MRTAVDTNVFSTLWSAATLYETASRLLKKARTEGSLVISAPVYVELLAHPKVTSEFVEDFVSAAGIDLDFDLGEEVWRDAGRRFARYAARRRASGGGRAKRLLADFLIGAHALARADRLLTFDASRYKKDFPELDLMSIDYNSPA